MSKRNEIGCLPHEYCVLGGVHPFGVVIDAENANFRHGVKYAHVHTASDGAAYIIYKRKTYYL